MFRSFRPAIFAIVVLSMILAGSPAEAGRTRGTASAVLLRDAESDRIMSDLNAGSGPNVEYVNGRDAVTITYNGSVLTMSFGRARPAENTRKIWLEFTDTVATGADGSPSAPHEQSFTQSITALTVTLVNVAGGFEGIAVGGTVDATLHADFAYGSGDRWFRFDNGLYPGSHNTRVTRIDATTWSVESLATDCSELLAEPARNAVHTDADEQRCHPCARAARPVPRLGL